MSDRKVPIALNDVLGAMKVQKRRFLAQSSILRLLCVEAKGIVPSVSKRFLCLI